jgi:hypothetical protein
VYQWVVLRYVTASPGAWRIAVTFTSVSTYYWMVFATDPSANWAWQARRVGGDETIIGAAANTQRHMLDYGTLSSAVAQAHRDTTAYNGNRTGALDGDSAPFDALYYGGSDVGLYANVEIVAHVIAHNTGATTALPSAGQIASMRSFLTSAYWRGYTGDSLGLP